VTAADMTGAASPYKFLDSYEPEDRKLFFGRDRETEMLLSDVVLSRLVVLFAKTGTGKTSLINAAVRPELERRGFTTFFVRVRRDPAASAREELLRHPKIAALEGDTLAAQLEDAARRLEGPIAVFFDQFEEFFLYLTREEPAKARAFVADLAALYRNRRSGVHVLLSMREDFYVELDAFRDDIPTIFHNDSNVRLRWFERDQARDAIIRPLDSEDVEVEGGLVERLLDDLSRRNGLVEPAQLQIVCDTVWRERDDGRLTLAAYRALGREDLTATIAEQIVSRRLAEQFEKFESREELALIERLLEPGVLSTERGTKYVRDLDGLARELNDVLSPLGGEEALQAVLRRLEESRLVRLYVRDDLIHVELTHDYLVAEPERLAELRRSVRDIWPRRVLEQGRADWDEERRMFAGPTTDLEEVLRRVQDEWADAAREGAASPEQFPLTADDATVLLRLALHRGIHKLAAYEIARGLGVPAWEIVLDTVGGPHVDDATYAVNLLGALGSREAVAALEEALADERLATEAQAALTAIAHTSADSVCAGEATLALARYLEGALRDPELAPLALEDLGRLDAKEAVNVLEHALRDPKLAGGAEVALRRLARSPDAAVAAHAQAALAAHAKPPPAPAPPPRHRAEPLLEAPSVKRHVTPSGDVDETHFALLAKSMLEGRVVVFLGEGGNVVGRPRDAMWQVGRYLPTSRELAEYLGQDLDLPSQPGGLAVVAQAAEAAYMGSEVLYERLHSVFDADYTPGPLHDFLARLPSLLREHGRVASQVIVTTVYDDTLERAFSARGEPYDLVFCVAYGDRRGRFAHRLPDGEVRLIEDAATYDGLSLEDRSVIIKLLGTVDRRDANGDSFLVTEDDLADFLAYSDVASVLPLPLAAKLQRSHVLFLGYGIWPWSQRLVLNRLFRDSRSSYRSWAVARDPDELEARLWRLRDVEVLRVDLEQYVAALEERLGGYTAAYA